MISRHRLRSIRCRRRCNSPLNRLLSDHSSSVVSSKCRDFEGLVRSGFAWSDEADFKLGNAVRLDLKFSGGQQAAFSIGKDVELGLIEAFFGL